MNCGSCKQYKRKGHSNLFNTGKEKGITEYGRCALFSSTISGNNQEHRIPTFDSTLSEKLTPNEKPYFLVLANGPACSFGNKRTKETQGY